MPLHLLGTSSMSLSLVSLRQGQGVSELVVLSLDEVLKTLALLGKTEDLSVELVVLLVQVEELLVVGRGMGSHYSNRVNLRWKGTNQGGSCR